VDQAATVQEHLLMMWIPAVLNMIFVSNEDTPLVTAIKSFWNAFIPKEIPAQKRADKQMLCITS
jgi:hypothetical protein